MGVMKKILYLILFFTVSAFGQIDKKKAFLLLNNSSASEFTPTSIPNLLMWYDLSDVTTVTDAGFGNVTDVADKSGNALHVSNVGGGNTRPLYLTAALNGLNTLQFTAATFQNLRRAKVTALQGISGLTIFHVGGKLGATVFHGFDFNNRTQILSDFTDNKSYAFIANGSGTNLSNTTSPAGYQRWDVVFDGTQTGNDNRLKCYLNDVLPHPKSPRCLPCVGLLRRRWSWPLRQSALMGPVRA
jgi:hypothetical protein